MIKFVKGEVVSYSSLIDIPVEVNVSHVIPGHPPTVNETIRLGNYLVVESIRLVSHNGECSIKFYGIHNHIAVSSLVEARRIFHRVTIKISDAGDGFMISNHNVFLRALKAFNQTHPSLANISSNDQSREFFGSIQAELNNTGSSPLYFGNSTILKETALDNRTCTFNLAAHALNSFETSTSVALDWSELLDARTSAEQNSIISFKIAQGIRRNTPTTITESYSADRVFVPPANWEKYGYEDLSDYLEDVERVYYDILEDQNIDEDNLSDEEHNHFMSEAERILVARLKAKVKNPKEEKINVKMLKFKDLLFINHNGSTKAAICLADIPEIQSVSTLIPVLIRDGNNYIQGSIPFVNILKKVPTLEDVATRVKITGYKESSDIFGYKKTKEAVIGNIYSYASIEKNFTCKKDNQVRDTIIVDLGKSNFRFVLSEVEFVFPTVNRVQIKKDKSIKIGSTCTICRNKGLNVPIGRKVTVLEIKVTPQGASSKKLFKNSKNRQLDLATVSDIETGKSFKTYLKNLKFIQ